MKIFLSICLFIWTLVPLKAQDILSLENQIIDWNHQILFYGLFSLNKK